MQAELPTKAPGGSKKMSWLLNWNIPQKVSKNASSPVNGILFTVFWNIFMVKIKEKTKSVKKINDA